MSLVAEFGKVAVLMGGPSSEREVSLMSGGEIVAALQSAGVDVISFDPAERSLVELPSLGVKRVFNGLHGRFGEDGTVQGALEILGIPYTGSGVAASALALDKYRTKLIWSALGIPTAPFMQMADAESAPKVLSALGTPLMVKPATEGSSIGISKVSTEAELRRAFEAAFAMDKSVIAEAFVKGRELTIAVLGNRVLPIIEIVAPDGNYDYQNKYFTDVVTKHCPADIPPATAEAIARDTLRAYDAIGCKGYARADLMLRSDGTYAFLEINTLPGMTSHSLVPIAARAIGLSFPELCVDILRSATTETKGAHVD